MSLSMNLTIMTYTSYYFLFCVFVVYISIEHVNNPLQIYCQIPIALEQYPILPSKTKFICNGIEIEFLTCMLVICKLKHTGNCTIQIRVPSKYQCYNYEAN